MLVKVVWTDEMKVRETEGIVGEEELQTGIDDEICETGVGKSKVWRKFR